MTDTEKINRIIKALGALKDLHNCESVRSGKDEHCPICTMWEMLP